MVKYPFLVIKRHLDHVKTGYRGLAKNPAQRFTLYAVRSRQPVPGATKVDGMSTTPARNRTRCMISGSKKARSVEYARTAV